MVRVKAAALLELCRMSLIAAGVKTDHAVIISNVLVAADIRGIFSHGCNRLEMYVKEAQSGVTDCSAEPKILKETVATAWIDGQNTHGAVVGDYSMRIAIEKARQCGIGWVVAKGSNHFGIAGYYSQLATDVGFVGMSFTNTSPLQVPSGGTVPALGTNPIAVAAPAQNNDMFSLDMATSTCPIGKIELAKRKGASIPDQWGVDNSGVPTNDPASVLNGGGLLPLGGTIETAGYKGYGLALMVELFCGIMGGSNYGTNIRPWRLGSTEPANIAQCFVAIDPNCFAPGFETRCQDILDSLRNQQPATDIDHVRVAGDIEKEIMEEQLSKGIDLHINVIEYLNKLATRMNIPYIEQCTEH